MLAFLTAGPFSARDGEGRLLFTDVTVELFEGELVVLDGPSGSGKSTLLRQLVGLEPTEGVERRLAGELFTDGQLPAWRAKVTLAAQDAPMLAATVGENLRFPFAQQCAGKAAPGDDRLAVLLDAAGIAEIPEDRDVSTLSGGERHRLALVRALLWDPSVLVVDEPLSGLDEDSAEACFTLLLDFARRPGRAVVCVLHERALSRRAHRVVPLASSAHREAP
ncbi:MAG: ATP-binding cassette domain-containing protein [Thermoanaerobaculales bacterium]|jgi:putative ABC transport system ATP-binding protein|nr:ATP-binding cassette domain-containing protein [Thermoanaerobaculales bacterium]